MRSLTIVLICLSSCLYSQKTVNVKAGEFADNILVGETTGAEVQSLLRKSNGSVCFREKAPKRMSTQTCSAHSEDGFSIVIGWTQDSTMSVSQQNLSFLNAKVSSVIVESPAIAVNENKVILSGKKEAELKKIYKGEFKESFDRDHSKKYIIYFSLGIAFTFDVKTDTCIEVEIFKDNKSFIYNFNKALTQN